MNFFFFLRADNKRLKSGDIYVLHYLINIAVFYAIIGVATAWLKHFQIAKMTITRLCMLNVSYSTYGKNTLLATPYDDNNYVLYGYQYSGIAYCVTRHLSLRCVTVPVGVYVYRLSQ